jgi:organic radical activating enzyme
MIKGVSVRFTNICNLNCSFCSNKLYGQEDHNVNLLLKSLIAVIENEKVEHVTILGGEPLLFLEIVNVISKIAIANNCKVTLMTNGILWSDELTVWANTNKIKVILGLQETLSGDKNITNLRNIDAIKNIDDFFIRKVVERSSKFADSTYLLNKIFGCNIELINDYMTLGKINIIDIYNFMDELNTLKKYGDTSWLSIHGMFQKECRCDDYLEISPNGAIRTIDKLYGVSSFSNSGCSFYAEKMGDLYFSFRKLIKEALL